MGIARDIARLKPNSSGLLPNANIEAVAASKLTGQVALATQVSGTLPDANAPSGSVIQVQTLTLTNAIAVSGTQMVWYDLTGVSITITPLSASSKMLLMANLQVGKTSFSAYFRFAGGNAGNFIGDTASARPRTGAVAMPSDDTNSNQHINALGMVYLDSPNTTSAITYKVQCAPQADFRTVYVNRGGSDRDVSNYDPRTASSFTIMEIAP